MELCRVCGKPAVNSCAACRSVFYCSGEHQKFHWKQHKSKCSAFIIKTNEEMGRYAVAARKLKAGSLVLEEIPVLYAPVNNPNGEDHPMCLSCCKVMPRKDFRECSKCKWPICSDECEKVEHAEFECKIFSDNNVTYPPNVENYYMGIMALRACLLKAKDPLLNLQDTLPIPKENRNNIRKIYEAQMSEFKVSNLCSIDEWSKMMDIINVNAKDLDVELVSNSETQNMKGKYLFIHGSFFNHSCISNCSWGLSPGVNADLKIRTTVDVEKGDVLTITYPGVNNLHGTMERQHDLREHAGFICKCARCVDSTELGSNVSTLVCPSCKKTTVTSTNPLNEGAPWKCYSCNHLKEAEDVVKLVASTSQIVRRKALDSSSIDEWMTVICDLSEETLHPNHWIINEICDKIYTFLDIQVQRDPKVGLNEEERCVYLKVTEHLLKISNILSPGLSRYTATLKSCLSREKTTQTENDFINGRIVHEQFKEEIVRLDEMIYDAYKFFKTDTSESLNGTLHPEAIALEPRIDQMKTLVLLASNEYLPVNLSSKKNG